MVAHSRVDFKVRNYAGVGREDKVESIFLSGMFIGELCQEICTDKV